MFREQGIRWTWQVFLQEVDVFAAGLLARDIGKGDRVGIWSPNRVEWLLTQFATARIGADYDHDQVGYNYRMTNLQAAVGCAQMELLDRFVAAKRRIAAACRLIETEDDSYIGFVKEEGDKLKITAANVVSEVPKKEVKGRRKLTQSLMPVGLEKTMTAAEFADLVAYLLTLDKGGPDPVKK